MPDDGSQLKISVGTLHSEKNIRLPSGQFSLLFTFQFFRRALGSHTLLVLLPLWWVYASISGTRNSKLSRVLEILLVVRLDIVLVVLGLSVCKIPVFSANLVCP